MEESAYFTDVLPAVNLLQKVALALPLLQLMPTNPPLSYGYSS